MSASESTAVTFKPGSPPVSASTATAAMPRSSSRPSFPIAYTQPQPSSVSSSLKQSPTDPKPVSHSTSRLVSPSTSRAPQPVSSHPPPSKHFVAPAHPQSHHLHSLPPREKTTRTLILDHTAWQHARTRFAQGRCELGMRVRFKQREQVKREPVQDGSTGGRDAFYIGAPRGGGTNAFGGPPEVELASSDEEDEDEDSLKNDPDSVGAMRYGIRYATEGKDAGTPASTGETRKGGDNTMDVDHNTASALDEGVATSNAAVAPALAARATGIEKVLNAMLAQPPSPPPRSPSPPPYALHRAHAHSQHYRAPPLTATQAATTTITKPHTLPNGVRLRLALLALVNDLFERQPDVASEELPASPTRPQASGSSNSNATESANPGVAPSPPNSPTQLPPPSLPPPHALPPALAMLATISSQPFHAPPTLPSFHTLPLPSSSASGSTTLSPISGTGMKTQSTTMFGGDKRSADGTQSRRPPPPLFTWSRLSEGTVSPSTPGAQLGASSQDMDAGRQSVTSPISPPVPRISATSRPPATSWQGSTLRYPNPGMTRRAVGRPRELYAVGCHAVPNPQTSGSRGSYRSDVVTYSGMQAGSSLATTPGYPLQKLKMLCPRHLIEKCGICATGKRGGPMSRIGAGLSCKVNCDAGTGSGVLTDMVPRFLRLSALVAMELGREARGEEADGEMAEGDSSTASTSAASNVAARPAQPTRAWYALLCGLLTRAVLEGYAARGWKGAEYAEVLLGVGLGSKTRKDTVVTAEEENTGEFEPDEMPGLVDAGKVLFAFAGDTAGALDADALEYTAEMESRVSEFLSIPHTTPDLATHLIGLSAQYPATHVERAALRFCEAVSQWRGRPELETYKSSVGARATTPGTLSIQALLASPAPTRPSIERYFRIIPASLLRKRANTDAEEGEERASKREKIDTRAGGRVVQDSDVDAEWVGPYGL